MPKAKQEDVSVALWKLPIVWGFSMLLGRPRDSALAVICALAIGGIVINSLYMQPGPHPAPIFILKHPPVVDEPAKTGAVAPRPRPQEIWQPASRGEMKPRVEPVVAKVPAPGAAPMPMPAARPVAAQRQDPIAELISGGNRMTMIQRALSDFGYGPVTASGTYGPETRAAIERFEREKKLPVTGQVSERLVKELSQLTGKQI